MELPSARHPNAPLRQAFQLEAPECEEGRRLLERPPKHALMQDEFVVIFQQNFPIEEGHHVRPSRLFHAAHRAQLIHEVTNRKGGVPCDFVPRCCLGLSRIQTLRLLRTPQSRPSAPVSNCRETGTYGGRSGR